MTGSCNLCGRPSVQTLLELGSHPIAHHLLSSPDEPEYTHPMTVGFCDDCGLTQIVTPVPRERLYTHYNWLSAWKWNPHLPRVLEIVDGLDGIAKDSPVLEIGSNDGSFLDELRKRGFTNLLGVEPAGDAAAAATARGLETVHAYFDASFADELAETRGGFDLVVCRQVLEHIEDLASFAEGLRLVLRTGAHVVVEVPDFDFSLGAPDYSALWEEHVNHFTERTLASFLGSVGVEEPHFERANFSGRILISHGRSSGTSPSPARATDEARTATLAYRDRWPRFRAALADYLERERAASTRIAVYGAGCRSCCLLNYAGVGPLIGLVVDDQVDKQGRYMPGSRLPILPSDALVEESVGLCLLAINAENEDAVLARHERFLETGGRFVSIHPPSPRLPSFWKDVVASREPVES